jgi:hypothetical protein
VSHISHHPDIENNMRASNVSSVSGMSKRGKNLDYMRLDKPQMKIVMNALIKEKRQLEKGENREASFSGRKNKSLFQ